MRPLAHCSRDRCPCFPRRGVLIVVLALSWLAATGALADELLSPDVEGLDAGFIVRSSARVLRGERTYIEAKMIVTASRGARPRELRYRSFDDRAGRRAFVRVLAPEKVAGTGFLKLYPNLWAYEPGEGRTRRIPQSQALEPFMGGDFTVGELVSLGNEAEGYEHRLLGVDPRPDDIVDLHAYVVESVIREPGPASWSRIVSWVESEHGTPLRREFYDADGALVRVMHFGAIREVQGRYFPWVWTVRPRAAKGGETRIEIGEIDFDASFDPVIFSPGRLKAAD